jgi:hypothetical protein
VVIVGEDDTAAALAGAVLARANYGPVLVSGPSGLGDVVEDEVVRLDPSGAFLLGDEEAVPASVVDDLTAAGIPEETIERLDGPDDATLAAARRLPVLFAEPDGVPPATAETRPRWRRFPRLCPEAGPTAPLDAEVGDNGVAAVRGCCRRGTTRSSVALS